MSQETIHMFLAFYPVCLAIWLYLGNKHYTGRKFNDGEAMYLLFFPPVVGSVVLTNVIRNLPGPETFKFLFTVTILLPPVVWSEKLFE